VGRSKRLGQNLKRANLGFKMDISQNLYQKTAGQIGGIQGHLRVIRGNQAKKMINRVVTKEGGNQNMLGHQVG